MLRALEPSGVEQLVGEQEQCRAGDRDDAGRETVEAVDEIDRVRHQHDPQRGDERRPVRRQHDDIGAEQVERHPEVEHRHAEQHEHARGEHLARDLAPVARRRSGRRARRRRRSHPLRGSRRTVRSCRGTSRGTGPSATRPRIAARKPTNIAAPPSVGVGFVCTWRASPDGATTAPNRIARHRTNGVSENVTASATARTIQVALQPGRCARLRLAGVRVDAYLLGYGVNLAQRSAARVLHVGGDARRRRRRAARVPISVAISLHLVGAHARGRDRGGAEPQSARDERLLGVVRDRVLVARDPGPVERLLRDLARDTERPQVDEHEVVVGPARHDAEALHRRARRRARSRCTTMSAAYVRNSAGSLRGTRPPWPRSRASADRPATRGTPPCRSPAACSCAAEDRAGARAPQRLVGRERHDVGERHRRRMRAAGDQTGDVRGVDDQQARRPRRRSNGTPRSR